MNPFAVGITSSSKRTRIANESDMSHCVSGDSFSLAPQNDFLGAL